MLTLITGGHGSGKTHMALSIASGYLRKTYIATAEGMDEEMQEKIRIHQAERDASYHTIEEPVALAEKIVSGNNTDLVIIDCLTVWMGNLLYYEMDADLAVNRLCEVLPQLKIDVVMITNESGMGIIPADSMTRNYQKRLASMNRRIAAQADKVCCMVSGLPLWLKK